MCYQKKAINMVVSLSVGLFLGGASMAGADVRYVDDDASLGGDGMSWITPYKYLQDALFGAAANPSVTEIRVAGGVYKPDQDEGGNVTPGDYMATFQLINGVGLRGGFAGMAHPCDPDTRDVKSFETTLSGDLLENDGPNFANYNENSHHVTTGTGTDGTAVIDGFVVTAGYAPWGNPEGCGAGMINLPGSPTVKRCDFRANWGDNHGAAMYNRDGSSPTLTDCTFTDNEMNWEGGAIFSKESDATLINCTFIGNRAGNAGGAISIHGDCTFLLMNCVFCDNQDTGSGGAFHIENQYGSTPNDVSLYNCTFAGNSADNSGGAVYCTGDNLLTVTNCIFWGNSDAGGLDESAQIHVVNCTPTISCSCIQGLNNYAGNCNTGDDPLFVNAAACDLRLESGSTCIDAGCNAAVPLDILDLDEDGNTTEQTPLDVERDCRFADDPSVPDCPYCPQQTDCGASPIVSMGAYEFPAPPDGDGDGVPDGEDVCPGTPTGLSVDCEGRPRLDLNGDCQLNGLDIQLIVEQLLNQ